MFENMGVPMPDAQPDNMTPEQRARLLRSLGLSNGQGQQQPQQQGGGQTPPVPSSFDNSAGAQLPSVNSLMSDAGVPMPSPNPQVGGRMPTPSGPSPVPQPTRGGMTYREVQEDVAGATPLPESRWAINPDNSQVLPFGLRLPPRGGSQEAIDQMNAGAAEFRQQPGWQPGISNTAGVSPAPQQQGQGGNRSNPLLTALQGANAQRSMMQIPYASLSDIDRFMNNNRSFVQGDFNPGSVTPFALSNESANREMQGRQAALANWLQGIQTINQANNATGQLGLQGMQALGLPGLEGSMGVAQNAERRASELHGDAMNRSRQIDTALITWLNAEAAAGRSPSARAIQDRRRALESSISPAGGSLPSGGFGMPPGSAPPPVVGPTGPATGPGGGTSPVAQQQDNRPNTLEEILRLNRPQAAQGQTQATPTPAVANDQITNFVNQAFAGRFTPQEVLQFLRGGQGGVAQPFTPTELEQWWGGSHWGLHNPNNTFGGMPTLAEQARQRLLQAAEAEENRLALANGQTPPPRTYRYNLFGIPIHPAIATLGGLRRQ